MAVMHKIVSKIVPLTGDRFELRNRMYQGCPTVACTARGRLFAGWYSGGSREPSLLNFNIVAMSDDGGLTWRELFAIDGDADRRLQSLDIQLFTDPQGRLWVCWVQRDYQTETFSSPGHLNEWAIVCDNPDAADPVFSQPRFVGEGFMRCKPTFLKDGRWLLPAYNWLTSRYAYLESRDNGVTFEERYAGEKVKTDFDETMFLERQDGSLWMLARTAGGFGALAEATSTDGGVTWTDGALTDIPNPTTRFYIQRLPSGRVLMVNNQSASARVDMTALLSEDDGRTWKYSLLLDARATSYPDVAVGPAGELYIIHDRGRCSFKEILISRVTEEDILAGKLQDHASYQNNIVSKAPPAPALGNWYKQIITEFDHYSFTQKKNI